jgi:hypothetical protein
MAPHGKVKGRKDAHSSDKHSHAAPRAEAAHEPEAPEPDMAPAAAPALADAEAAYGCVAAALDALEEQQLVAVRVDAQTAGLVALGVDARLRDPARRKLITGLAKLGVADLDALDGLADAALAAWFSRQRLLDASARTTTAALPAATRTDATECRKRMRATLEYNVQDTESVRVLKALRAGRGDLDLAKDLVAYADLLVKNQALVAHDKTNYRPGDPAAAKELAGEIGKALTGVDATEVETWTEAQQRAYTLLSRRYDEGSRVGRFLDHDAEGRFYPSLVTASRAAPQPAKSPAPPPEPPATS